VRLVFAALLAVLPALPQTWDTTGNALLTGAYNFRQVVWQAGDSSGNLARAVSISGTITFDGNGNYSLANLHTADTASASPSAPAATGAYSIAASGYGFLSSPLFAGDQVFGLVAQGIFIGSSTENRAGHNDLFIAARAATPVFQGAYTLAGIDFPTASIFDVRDSLIQLSPDGTGNASGYVTATGLAPINQYFSGLKYSANNGIATLDFGGAISSSNLIAGAKTLYLSPDGNFVFGGSLTGWDMLVGVRPAGLPKFSGLYYQAGVDEDNSQVQPATPQHPATGSAALDTWYGAFTALSGGQILGHQRMLSANNGKAVHSTYAASYAINSTGADDSNNLQHYFFGAGGAIRIGLGNNPLLGISVALAAPALKNSGVFLDPTRITNAASSAPFTAGIAPGELITLYGTNLAAAAQYDPTFPGNIAGVQVRINNRPAPLIFASPTQLSALVPFATAEAIASIQVINNGTPSNTVTAFVNQTAPGVYTVPSGGLGYAAALHGDYSLVTPTSPAQPGEVVQVFVTGLGAVNPPVTDAAPGPGNPFSWATNPITASIGGAPATVQFDGLAPQLSGLYQINVQVPTGLSDGSVYLSISGPDAASSEALLPVASP